MARLSIGRGLLTTCVAIVAAGCGSDSSGGGNGRGGSGNLIFGNGGSDAGPTNKLSVPLPTDFTPGQYGGYALGDPVTSNTPEGIGTNGADGGNGCNVLVGVVRDFKGANEPGGHPDFEAFAGNDVTPNLVAMDLGSDQKPVYASRCEANFDPMLCPYGQMTTSKAYFDEWYRNTPGVNKPYLIYFEFAADGNKSTFSSNAFFPLDGKGWGNSPQDNGAHNFGFTTELHTQFAYHGGEQFTFTGDDDVWVFVDRKLAIDLGGLHPSQSRTLDLDDSAGKLGIKKGGTYALDLFHAERHSVNSDFRVDTTLAFSNCGTIVPDIH